MSLTSSPMTLTIKHILLGKVWFLHEMTIQVFAKCYEMEEHLKSTKIISQESIGMMTKPYSKYEDNGFEIGFSFFVLTDPDCDGTNSLKGIFGWSGYHNTHF